MTWLSCNAHVMNKLVTTRTVVAIFLPGTLIVLKSPYPWRVEEPSIYESVRVHTAIQTGRTESDLVANAPSVCWAQLTHLFLFLIDIREYSHLYWHLFWIETNIHKKMVVVWLDHSCLNRCYILNDDLYHCIMYLYHLCLFCICFTVGDQGRLFNEARCGC